MWMWNDDGSWGLPRMGVEALRTGGNGGGTTHSAMLNLAFPDRRVVSVRANAQRMPVDDGLGRPRVLGVGPLRFECVEPFARWRASFAGVAMLRDVGDQLVDVARPTGTRTDVVADQVALRIELECNMALPPWVLGSLEPEGRFNPGEQRFEQLFRARGTLWLDGTETSFVGGGLRVHRTGGDRGQFRDWYGHCWQSSLFPSGRGFGFIHYRPRPDGSVRFREGWLAEGGEVVPARVEGTPWMTGAVPAGEDVSFTLRTPSRAVRIEAETFVSTFRRTRPAGDTGDRLVLQSGITRCRWGNEESYGMIERSAHLTLPSSPDAHRGG